MTTTLFVLCLERYVGDRECSVHLSLAAAEAQLRQHAAELFASCSPPIPMPHDVDLMRVLIGDPADGGSTNAWILRCSVGDDGDCGCEFCEPFENAKPPEHRVIPLRPRPRRRLKLPSFADVRLPDCPACGRQQAKGRVTPCLCEGCGASLVDEGAAREGGV